MGVPDYETLMRPTLAALGNGQPQTRSQIRDAVAAATGIGEDELAEMLPSGKATVFGSRVGWALTYMSQAALVTRPKRGVYVIADRGRTVLDEHPERVDNKVLEQFPEFLEFKARRNEKGEPVGTHGEPSAVSVSALSPTEAIERLVSDADDAVAAELLDRVLAQPPAFLELLSLRLLRAMGYGGREALLIHTGKPGDRGLDGLIRQDALGLDLVGVQAKRYDRDTAVQRPEMQAFVGALQGAQTSRGVFVTTGRFSSGARQFADSYLEQLRATTRIAPMIWLAGNHDSPDTVAVMRSIPGVTVLGTKTATGSGGYRVGAQDIAAYGLTIAAMPDPRVYGGAGDFGASDGAAVNTLEHRAVDAAVAAVAPQERFDIFATHEPVAAQELIKDLPHQIRQTNTGHLHAQNSDKDIQNGSPITLNEGSTGAGGLDNLNRGVPAPPIEFSVESVAANCQFTKITRLQITGTAPSSSTNLTPGDLPQVTASTRYLKPQDIASNRDCSTSLGLSQPANL